MRGTRTIFLLALALACSFAPVDSPRGAAFAAAPPPNGRTGSVEVDGCTMEVELPKAPEAGSPVRVRVKITNTGKVPVVVRWAKQAALHFDLELTTGAKPVPLTRYGVKKIAPTELLDQLSLSNGSIWGTWLRPGGTWERDSPNLALYYDLTVPGEYVLAVSKHLTIGKGPAAKGVRLRVKGLRLTILDP